MTGMDKTGRSRLTIQRVPFLYNNIPQYEVSSIPQMPFVLNK